MTSPSLVGEAATAEEMAAKAVEKRYEGLVVVRNKAVKGKGAWYWAHLEPLLVHNAETGLPKAVKLRCSLCDAVFSASNPSRTASEHLKRATCPNFTSPQNPQPLNSISPPPNATSAPPPPPPHTNHRKRSSFSGPASSSSAYALSTVDPISYQHQHQQRTQHSSHLVLSGGKEDLGALALLEDRVKKLRSTKTSPGPTLTKTQMDTALDSLTDWVYESIGSVSFKTLDHPKFRDFLAQVGLPGVFSRRELGLSRLDLKFEEARVESEERIRDAMFFQVASDGWKVRSFGEFGDVGLVNLTVNLPNGTSVYRRAVLVTGSVPPRYAEEVLWETITGICGNMVQKCVGVVADRFKSKALKNLEAQHQWMVNFPCQFQGFVSLIEDFWKELPLFRSVSESCSRLAGFVNNKAQVRSNFLKYQLQECGYSGLLRVPMRVYDEGDFGPVFNMMEDLLSSARVLQMVVIDESYKLVAMEDPEAREVAEMIRNAGFWNELGAVHSLVKLVKEMAQDIEAERPLVGQCLPLWDELRAKVKDWCSKFHIAEGPVEKVVERRFNKNYHPAWAAAYVLDPLYLVRDTSGKYLPPFKYLTPEQEKDVDKLLTRLVSREEAHIALMELMKWRTEGLDPVYARAVQMKERDPVSGKMRTANPQSSRLVWETYLTEFKSLGRVAVRLIFLHATSCGFKCNWSLLKWVCSQGHSRSAMDKVQKLIFIAAHSKLERRDFASNEYKDAELLAMSNGEDNVLNEVLVDTSSV